MLIDGKLVEAQSGKTFQNVNPATEEVLGDVADAGAADMDAAIGAARRAFDETDWSTNHKFRQQCILQLQAALEAEQEALLAYATDGFLIGTAMRPHAGIGQEMAHRSLDTGVLTHTLTFHRPVPVAEWLLMAHEGAYAGGGRAYGRAHVFDRDGNLVASFVQESLIRQGRT